jgi:hypothetical protein
MRLVDLEPVWIKGGYMRNGVGVRFLCPNCRRTQLAVLFMNPLDGGSMLPRDNSQCGEHEGRRWARSGMSFEDLTVSPSIDASRPNEKPCQQEGGKSHWHGSVVGGQLV